MELVDARKQARYTQQDAADELGISRITYAKMEKDPDTISIADAKRLADFFGVTVEEIFFETDCN